MHLSSYYPGLVSFIKKKKKCLRDVGTSGADHVIQHHVPHKSLKSLGLCAIFLPSAFVFFFFFLFSGLPAGSGVLASQGDQPKKGGIFFFFSMILICVVCSINADATLRYAPLRTLSGQKNFSTSAKMSRQTVKTAALTRILHIISRSPPLRNKKKYVRSVACRRFLV